MAAAASDPGDEDVDHGAGEEAVEVEGGVVVVHVELPPQQEVRQVVQRVRQQQPPARALRRGHRARGLLGGGGRSSGAEHGGRGQQQGCEQAQQVEGEPDG